MIKEMACFLACLNLDMCQMILFILAICIIYFINYTNSIYKWYPR